MGRHSIPGDHDEPDDDGFDAPEADGAATERQKRARCIAQPAHPPYD